MRVVSLRVAIMYFMGLIIDFRRTRRFSGVEALYSAVLI